MKYPILLCCLNSSDKSVNVDEYTFYQIFSPQAVVKNIKIFKHNEQIKAFVQVEDESTLNRLIDNFHQKHLNIGRLKVFPSHKKFVAFDKSLKSILSEKAKFLSVSRETIESPEFKPESPKNHYIANSLANKFSQKTKSDVLENKKFYNFPQNSEGNVGYLHSQPYFKYNDLKNSPKATKIDSLVSKNSEKIPASKNIDKNINLILQAKTNFKCNLLKLENIDVEVITCQMLLNLFGCFGNILRLAIHCDLNFAIAEFEDEEQAELTLTYINGLSFFGNTLKLAYSNDRYLLDEAESKPTNELKFIKGFYKYFRYKPGLHIKVNKPSRLLHFTSLAPNITESALCQLIYQIHEPIKILKLGKKGTDSDMYLIEFKHLFQSLEVLSILHNKKVEGKLLKISFSHTKIDKY